MKIVLTLLVFALFSIPGICTDTNSDSNRSGTAAVSQDKGALENFKFKGKPVHPGCVREFDVPLADSPPPIVRAVDVEACVTGNEFYMPFKTDDRGFIGYEYDLGEGGKGSFSYKYLGKTPSGIHVLDTGSSGGGTMVATSIFLIKAATQDYWDYDEHYNKILERRLIMTCAGQITIGDRDRGAIYLSRNQLIIGPSQYRNKVEVINLD